MNCVDCGTFIPQGQVGFFIGGSSHLPVCRVCKAKERGETLEDPRPPLEGLYPGMIVGHLANDKLLELLYYWPDGTGSRVMWQE